jgi:hypothetical protein
MVPGDTDHKQAFVTLEFSGQQGPPVPFISLTEAAALIRFRELPDRTNRNPVQTSQQFSDILNALRKTGNASEPDTVFAMRHPWSVFGGERRGADFVTFLQMCLEKSAF